MHFETSIAERFLKSTVFGCKILNEKIGGSNAFDVVVGYGF